MRARAGSVTFFFGITLLSAAAYAAPESSKAHSERGAPGAAAGAPASGVEAAPSGSDTPSSDSRPGGVPAERVWGVGVYLESHVALVQDEPNDNRNRPSKLYDYLYTRPTLYPSRYDQIYVELGAYQFFTADQGESGLRLADGVLSYTRFVPIATEDDIAPSAVPMRGALLRVEADATAPFSLTSQLRSIITVPRLRVYVDKAFLDRDLLLGLNSFGEHYFVHYRSAQGGDANISNRAAFEATAEYRMPFWRPLSVRGLLSTSYLWYYGPDTAHPLPYGNVGDATYQHQPIQQRYGAEARVAYALPTVADIRPSIWLTYSIGDNTALHDGVQHLYFTFYRRASEVYATLYARY
jgi:hypothetical protein